jgi:hypothetical protein
VRFYFLMMELSIPLNDVQIEVVTRKKEIQYPLFSNDFYTLNQNEFSLDVDKVAWFYASGGKNISVFPYPGADESSIRLYLNGSVYGAILHQRKVLPLHGSSFIFNGKGIVICGESGSGKSSVTASFCLNGAGFLSDDITPVIFEKGSPCILSISDHIKLWGDSLKQLKQKEDGLQRIDPVTDKFYYHIDQGKSITFPLDYVFVLDLYDKNEVECTILYGSEKFAALRNEIYRYEYLQGMPENEAVYFQQLIEISRGVEIARIVRPSNITIEQFREGMLKIIASYSD